MLLDLVFHHLFIRKFVCLWISAGVLILRLWATRGHFLSLIILGLPFYFAAVVPFGLFFLRPKEGNSGSRFALLIVRGCYEYWWIIRIFRCGQEVVVLKWALRKACLLSGLMFISVETVSSCCPEVLSVSLSLSLSLSTILWRAAFRNLSSTLPCGASDSRFCLRFCIYHRPPLGFSSCFGSRSFLRIPHRSARL